MIAAMVIVASCIVMPVKMQLCAARMKKGPAAGRKDKLLLFRFFAGAIRKQINPEISAKIATLRITYWSNPGVTEFMNILLI